MLFTQHSKQMIAGQNDVQSPLHIPTVYMDYPQSPALWEYHVLSIDTRETALPDEEQLNELGGQGWLLVNIQEQRLSETGALVYYYFVRSRQG